MKKNRPPRWKGRSNSGNYSQVFFLGKKRLYNHEKIAPPIKPSTNPQTRPIKAPGKETEYPKYT